MPLITSFYGSKDVKNYIAGIALPQISLIFQIIELQPLEHDSIISFDFWRFL